MKRFSLLLGLVLIVTVLALAGSGQVLNAQDPLAPSGDGGQTYFAPFPVDITLDGNADDWEGVPRVIMSDGGDPEVSFAASADDEFLYFLGDVTDSNIISGEHGADYWNEDSIEFYLNATGDLGLRTYIDGVAQINIPALNIDLPTDEAIISGVRGSSANATVAAEATEDGYLVEVAVPLQNDVWNIELAHGNAVGFQVHLNGARETSRDTKLIWSLADTNDLSYQNPSLFGTLILYEIGRDDIPEPPSRGEEDAGPGLPQVDRSALYFNGRLPAEARVIDLMARMTLEEKLGQMTLVEINSIPFDDIAAESIGGILSGGGGYPQGNNTTEGWADRVTAIQDIALNTRLGIPVIYGVDAVHGHSNLYGATIFPHNIGLGATRNADLVQEICRVTALETVATGIYWNYSPVLAVAQDVRWGRTYEAYAQDTELVSELATACMIGLQGEDLSLPTTMLATPKHYVGDGGAVWGTSTTNDYQIDQGVTDIDEETLRAIHLPPYIDAIENGAQSIMISYTSWGGIKMHGQQYLITDVLRNELGYEGFIVSDWQGIDQITDDYYDSVVAAINAGIDLNMVPYDYIGFIETMKQAISNGDIPMSRIDDAVRRILIAKFEMGLFEDPYPVEELQPTIGSGEHRAVARQAVQESQVLLKNEGSLLPLSPDAGTILVAGEAADDVGIQSGGWTIEWQGGVGDITIGTTILEGVQGAVADSATVEYAADGDFGDLSADVGIVVVGERPYAEGIGDDPDLQLSETDLAAIENLQAHVDQVVVVLVSGRPLMITDHIDNWDAVVAAWLPGTEGQGVADTLFGYAPFTGQLSFSWPASVDQTPMTPANEEGALFEYGFGLTTEATQAPMTMTFAISDFEVEELPAGQDEFGNNLGFVAWGDTPNVQLELVPADSDLALPEQDGDNTVLQASYDVGAFGGFSYVPMMDDRWAAWDWSDYDGISFWLYGNNTGGTVQVEIFDNRNPELNSDSAERFAFQITDDYDGWQRFDIPFSDFQRRTDFQPGGALEDGLGLYEVAGIAFGFPAGVGAQTAYIDQIEIYGGAAGIPPRVVIPASSRPIVTEEASTGDAPASAGFVVDEVTLLNDFEFDAVPEVTEDNDGNQLGLVAWGDSPGNVTLSVGEVDSQRGLEISYDIIVFGGFSWVPGGDGVWEAQDWTSYDGIQFDLYGNNTGGTISVQLFDNRATDTTADSAERFFFLIEDDYEGWQTFAIPFSAFQRRTDWQPGGAPDDGLGLNEVHGLAFEFPSGVGAQVAYLDNLSLVTGEGSIAVDPVAIEEEPAVELPPDPEVLVVTETELLNDFDLDALPETTTDADGNALGLIAWGDTPDNVMLSLAEGGGDLSLEINYDIATFGGFSWVPGNDGVWVAQDWTSYDGVQFDLYGNNTGAVVQVEIFDNREENATTDSAERFFFHITDDYEGWQTFTIPFSEFQRRTDWQPGGAPDDGLGLTEVHGLAFGFPAGTGPQTAYLDDLALVSGDVMTATDAAIATYPWDGEWELIWADEFDAEADTVPNPEFWTCEVGGWGWGNNEHQYYTESGNAFHNGDGQMVIEAREETVEGSNCWYGECLYSSARCITKDSVEFMFGRVEMRAQIPFGQGIWPAFWMLGADFPDVVWPESGEIDIMENIGRERSTVHGTVHGPGYSGAAGRGRSFSIEENFSDDFYVYSIEWEPDVIRWYVDGELYFEFTPEGLNREYVFNDDFFLLMNLAVGGNWPGYPDETTVFPQTYTIDYIRVYQRQAPME
jgi:beta-glucosidase